jgi:chromosome segregation ATPase
MIPYNRIEMFSSWMSNMEECEFTVNKQTKTIEKYQEIVEAKDWFINQIELDSGEFELDVEKLTLSNHELLREVESITEFYDDRLDEAERTIDVKNAALIAKDQHIQDLIARIQAMSEDAVEQKQIADASREVQFEISEEIQVENKNLQRTIKEQGGIIAELEHNLMCANDTIDTMDHLKSMVREQSDMLDNVIFA